MAEPRVALGIEGYEPSVMLFHYPALKSGTPGRTRTYGYWLRRPAPFRLGYGSVVDPVGFEPTTSALQGRRSPGLSYEPMVEDTGLEPVTFTLPA